MLDISNSTYYYILTGWILLALIAFPFLLRQTQPYGRHTSSSWGPLISNKAGWIIMELPALLIMPGLYFLGTGEKSFPTDFFAFLWVLHYFNRTIVFPLRTKTKGKKMPLVIVLSAILFNSVNGFVNGYYFGFMSPYYDSTWYSDYRFIFGFLIFLVGIIINWSSDNYLINIRYKSSDEYRIPQGGLFTLISCPNHFGEMMEWLGFAILTWSLPAFSFALWTCVNLIPRAIDHHRWYKTKFPDYPKDRKAVIPFLL